MALKGSLVKITTKKAMMVPVNADATFQEKYVEFLLIIRTTLSLQIQRESCISKGPNLSFMFSNGSLQNFSHMNIVIF